MLKRKQQLNVNVDPTVNGINCTRIDVVDIDSVTPWVKNPKRYKNKIDELVVSIKEYGQRTPCSVWVEDGVIYKGNNTWYAMKKMGFKKIAILWEEFNNQQQAISYALIDNKTGENQEWDPGKLADLLQGETYKGVDPAEISRMTGFKESDLRSFLLTTEELPDVLPDVEIDGGKPDKADFMVIQFKSADDMTVFKKRLGFETKHPRVVHYEDLLTVMSWNKEEPVKTHIASARKLMLKRK